MRVPPLLADFIYNRVCELKCEKFLTRPEELQEENLLTLLNRNAVVEAVLR